MEQPEAYSFWRSRPVVCWVGGFRTVWPRVGAEEAGEEPQEEAVPAQEVARRVLPAPARLLGWAGRSFLVGKIPMHRS